MCTKIKSNSVLSHYNAAYGRKIGTLNARIVYRQGKGEKDLGGRYILLLLLVHLLFKIILTCLLLFIL